MITVFNRALLYQGADAEEAARIWSTLEKNGIKYEMKTKTGSDPMERQLKQRANINFMAGGVPASYMAEHKQYLYLIYVNKNDLTKAREILN